MAGARRTSALARIRRAAAALLVQVTAAELALGALTALPGPAAAQPDPYRQHMDNGIKLFHDGNFEAALVEFEAAYKARPKASPLLNIALCQKARFRYPKAIAALELALAKHRDTMDESDIRSAEQAIQEMRALLARVSVQVTPPSAKLFIDGEEQPPSATGAWTLELGPGQHRIAARAEGHAGAEESVTVVSGEKDRKVELALAPDKGLVTVEAGDPQMAIAVDQQFMAYGRWAGYLAPGTHIVQMYEPGGRVYSTQVIVAAGKEQEIRPGKGGVSITGPVVPPPRTLPPPPPPPPRPATVESLRRGWFLFGAASLVWPMDKPAKFPEIQANSGGAGALRAGYRVNNAASFDVMVQYMNINVEAAEHVAPPPGLDERPEYTFEAGRLGLNLRLMSPGEMLRATASVGGGLSFDSVRFNDSAEQFCPGQCFDAEGIDPFLLLDAGVELDFGGALVGLALESYFQSSRGIDLATDDDRDLYEPRALIHLGGSVRVGYAWW